VKLVHLQSPNQSQRIGEVRLVIAHTPEGSYRSAIATCMSAPAKVSYHRVHKKDGSEATQLVPFARKAWHALSLNDLAIGISIEDYASKFSIADPGALAYAQSIAECLLEHGLKPQWTTDVALGGFCRHGDLQSNRTDPTPDMAEWRRFVRIVQRAYDELVDPEPVDPERPWPLPLPAWFWTWARWTLGEGEYARFGPKKAGRRPKDAPTRIPSWAWKRLELLVAQRD
jgi:N-acetyl-anhydromuramyl-L-alanine amidase AmpD